MSATTITTIKIDRKALMTRAHQIARETKAVWVDEPYADCFAAALVLAHAEMRMRRAAPAAAAKAAVKLFSDAIKAGAKKLTKRERRMVREAEQCLESRRTCSPRTLCEAQSAQESCTKHAGLVATLDSALSAKLTARAAELAAEWAQAAAEAQRFEAAFFGPRYRARQQARFDRQYRIAQLSTVNNPYV